MRDNNQQSITSSTEKMLNRYVPAFLLVYSAGSSVLDYWTSKTDKSKKNVVAVDDITHSAALMSANEKKDVPAVVPVSVSVSPAGLPSAVGIIPSIDPAKEEAKKRIGMMTGAAAPAAEKVVDEVLTKTDATAVLITSVAENKEKAAAATLVGVSPAGVDFAGLPSAAGTDSTTLEKSALIKTERKKSTILKIEQQDIITRTSLPNALPSCPTPSPRSSKIALTWEDAGYIAAGLLVLALGLGLSVFAPGLGMLFGGAVLAGLGIAMIGYGMKDILFSENNCAGLFHQSHPQKTLAAEATARTPTPTSAAVRENL